MRATWLRCLVAVSLLSCITQAPAAVTHPLYSFGLNVPPADLRPGETRQVWWNAAPAGESEQAARVVRLCFAIVGPYASPQEVKAAAQPRPSCPIASANAVFVSDVREVDAGTGAFVTQDLRIPADAAPGLYSVFSVEDSGASAIASASLVRVVSPSSANPTPRPEPNPFASVCGEITQWQRDTTTQPGSVTLTSPGREPFVATIPAGRLGASAAGYVCFEVTAGIPRPLFDGFFTPGTPGYVPDALFPATAAFPAPPGFMIPQLCAYAAAPVVSAERTEWAVDCGRANNDARGTLGRALEAQGWRPCGSGLAVGYWRNRELIVAVVESSLAPGDFPKLHGYPRLTSPCA